MAEMMNWMTLMTLDEMIIMNEIYDVQETNCMDEILNINEIHFMDEVGPYG
jgi:hypothetical protein